MAMITDALDGQNLNFAKATFRTPHVDTQQSYVMGDKGRRMGA
jgi:hypothetical protein